MALVYHEIKGWIVEDDVRPIVKTDDKKRFFRHNLCGVIISVDLDENITIERIGMPTLGEIVYWPGLWELNKSSWTEIEPLDSAHN
jgi:hypothetical protein